MKLYYSPGACSLTVRIILHELNVKAEYEAVNLKTKRTADDKDYLEINPKGAVPLLVTDEKEFLTENVAILEYLADHFQSSSLLPALADFKRYRVLEFLGFLTSDVHKGFGPLFNPTVTADAKENIFIPQLLSKFKYLDKILEQKEFLMGDTFTLPDAYLFVMLRWALPMKVDISSLKNLMRYKENLQNRNSIVTSLQEENLKA